MPPPVAINYLIITEMVTQSQSNGGLLFYLKRSGKVRNGGGTFL